jgi:hypothetical protein
MDDRRTRIFCEVGREGVLTALGVEEVFPFELLVGLPPYNDSNLARKSLPPTKFLVRGGAFCIDVCVGIFEDGILDNNALSRILRKSF